MRDWLRALTAVDRRTIGEDIRTVQIGWPLGMPLVRKLATDLWEVRITLPTGIARVLFTVSGNMMLLLHGFIKKSQGIPRHELDTAKDRLRLVQRSSQ